MANHASTRKRIKTDAKRHARNVHFKSMMKTSIKKVLNATDKNSAEALFREATGLIDRVAAKRIIHRKRAAAHKSKLAKHIGSLA